MKKGLTQISQMTQIKNENRYGMNRIKGIYKISNISSVGKTAIIEGFQPGEKTSVKSLIFLPEKEGLSHNLPKVHFLPFSGIQRCILKRRLFLKVAYIYCLKTNF
jgi:hypothetical protein